MVGGRVVAGALFVLGRMASGVVTRGGLELGGVGSGTVGDMRETVVAICEAGVGVN